jgi:hypothetical protein
VVPASDRIVQTLALQGAKSPESADADKRRRAVSSIRAVQAGGYTGGPVGVPPLRGGCGLLVYVTVFDNEENYLLVKLLRGLGVVAIENQARV